MKERFNKNGFWLNSLAQMMRGGSGPLQNGVLERLDDQSVRIALVSRTRWIMLVLVALYGVVAAASYSLSSVGFCFNTQQTIFLFLTVIAIVLYNFLLCYHHSSLRRFSGHVHLQVSLDLLFVTALIHFTGGVVSWFWPVYLLVTLESAFLFEDRRDVWMIGTLGAVLYGALLTLENLNILPPVKMPFIEDSLHNAFLFQLLMWFWVAGINAAVGVIAAFLMETIRRDNRRVKESEEALLGFIISANDLIFSCRLDGTLVYANQICKDLLRFGEEELGTISILEFTPEEVRQQLVNLFTKIREGEQTGHFDLQFISRNGDVIDVEMSLSAPQSGNKVPTVWGVGHDVTERKIAQQELYKLAHHDILTGLPNRVLLQDRLQQAKALAHRMKCNFAMLFLDLDRFKIINDTLGHSVGDELLRLVAGRLRRTLREIDTVARIGGDEFVILLVNIHGRQDVTALAEKILKSLVLPFNLREHELFITTSLGICLFPDDEDDVEVMMKKADVAMYHAKALGRNNFQFYTSDMDQNASRRFVLSNSLRRGLEQKEFKLYYQPKVNVITGMVVAMEALVRWQHPELGLLSPTEFIQLAEENGLIVQLGDWVLREACLQNVTWHNDGLSDMRVAVNLSGYQLQHKNLLSSVQMILAETGMSPERLEFEITESVIMQNPDFAVAILNEISNLGIHISIDDFGTGYSSLAHLKRFSVNTLKIDKSFVKDVDLNSTDAAIATAIIAMGNSLKLNVIAEGVETQAQYDFLKDNNCDQIQGYFISKPVPSNEMTELLVIEKGKRDTQD